VSEADDRRQDRDPRRPGGRAPYEPPRITFTELSVEEALMAICKSGSEPGPIGTCSTGCSTPGS